MEDSHAAAQLRALAETTPDVLVTIDADSYIQFINPAVEDVLGYAPDELVGEPLTRIMPEGLANDHEAAVEQYLETGTETIDWQGIDLPGQHRDGHQVPLRISFSEFVRDGERFFTGIMRDVSAQQRWADRLERLTEFGQEFLDAETVEAVCDGAIAAAEDALDAPLAEIALYDANVAELVTQDQTAAAERVADGASLFRADRGLAWEVFVQDEGRSFGDEDEPPPADETALASAAVVPMGPHGVFVAGDTTGGGLSRGDRRVAWLLASTVAAILDRLDRERSLRERTGELEAKHEQYERVRRLNDVIRDITQVLLSASSREEIKQVVCDRLATSAPYRFVWFGEHDVTTDEVSPTAWAGVEKGYLDAVEITADRSETGEGPVGRAVRSDATQIQNDLQVDPPFEPWRQEAIRRGYRAAIVVPVRYRETQYGVLALYASEADVFTEMEREVLTELGEMVGYGLNAMERYDALVSEESVELEFLIRDEENPLVQLLEEHEGRFHLESIGERHADAQRVFLTFEGVPLDAIRSFASEWARDEPKVVREREGEVLVRLTLPPAALISTLLDRGVVPTDLRGTPDEARLTVRISREASVRELVDLFEERYDDVELLARRASPQPVRTVQQFERAFAERITERQEEVLRTAYYAGFFEQPRESSARDVAEILGVSQPTVSRHVRAGEKRLFSLLFDEA